MNVFIAKVITDKNVYMESKKQKKAAVQWAKDTAAQVAEFETTQQMTVWSEQTGKTEQIEING